MSVLYCQLPDLFAEAWNLCSSVIVNCSDITSMNCDIKISDVLSILDVTAWQFLSENATGDEHKKLKISWNRLHTWILIDIDNF